MSAHATFAPSAAHRWMSCPGSIALTRDAPRTSSVYADEGTAAHQLATRALDGGKDAVFYLGETFQVGERVFEATQEMVDAVQMYLDAIHLRMDAGSTLMYEQRVSFAEAIGVPEQSGTADAIILNRECTRLVVGDLKYGMGVKVFAEENEQLMTYAVGVLETFAPIMEDVEEVELLICQPRLDHIDSWVCSIERLRQHAEAMRVAAGAALEGCAVFDGLVAFGAVGSVPEALLHPSEDACRFCPAKTDCPALRAQISALVFDDFKVLDNPVDLAVMAPPTLPKAERLGVLYAFLDMIEDYCRSARAEVERMVFAGMTVIGADDLPMKLVEGKKGNRTWVDVDQAKALLAGVLLPEEYLKPQEIISPAAADKLLKKQKAIIAPLVQQADGRPKVVNGSDPRPPYHAESSAAEFKDLGEAE